MRFPFFFVFWGRSDFRGRTFPVQTLLQSLQMQDHWGRSPACNHIFPTKRLQKLYPSPIRKVFPISLLAVRKVAERRTP
jgi:hypothetical protein